MKNTLQRPEIQSIPGMLSKEEQEYLHQLTSIEYQGRGAIVEIGSWLGNSAACLAQGLVDGKKMAELHCYDRFSADPIEIVKAKKYGLELVRDQDTTNIFKNYLKPIGIPVTAYKCNAKDINWKLGDVEILHLDAPKKVEDIKAVLREFLPHLIPGVSTVVFQDFTFAKAYGLPLIVESLENVFEFLCMPNSDRSTVSFKYHGGDYVSKLNSINPSNISAMSKCWFNIKNKCIPRDKWAYFDLGWVRYLIDCGYIRKAHYEARKLNSLWSNVEKDQIAKHSPDVVELLHINNLHACFLNISPANLKRRVKQILKDSTLV
jgi:hypothetical protein